MARKKIVVAEALGEAALNRLRAGYEVTEPAAGDRDALLAAVADAAALIVRTYTRVDAGVLAAAPQLEVVARAGSGVENIDVAAARAAGVRVVHRPTAAITAVAELTIGLIIALDRHLLEAHDDVRAGRFSERRNALAGRQLHGSTLGIVGYGRIGSRTAGMAFNGLGMRILYNDIRAVSPAIPATACALPELLTSADVVSLHVPLTADTRRLIDRAALARMPAHALLINTARGAVIDAAAVAEALRAGRLGGAAVDVFEPEPPPPDHPLVNAPRCILTPHIGARTRRALDAMSDVVDDVMAVLEGREPRYPYDEDPPA